MVEQSNPPRNGEGNHAQHGGGVGNRRIRHRTVGASDDNVRIARQLRRSLSLPEVVLWQHLRKRPNGFKFRRQFPCRGYVVDFACLECRIAVEIDGEAHSMGNGPERDAIRDHELGQAGFKTLRIAARDALDNLPGVLAFITSGCENGRANRPLHPSASRIGPPPRTGED